ncbi:hypothetical protein ACIHEI_28050 [Kitasatospora sp. NPDC051984]|uniref:hypothetical protein n=1 Tax=Kitasatospora sp. NPDC051984 TaxID=3364059 RepID=UPI0037C8BBF8
MIGDQYEVGRLLRAMAFDARRAARGGVPPVEPVDVAEQLQDVLVLQQDAAANATRFNQASPDQQAARAGALAFARAAARLSLVGAVLGEALEAAAHRFDAETAALTSQQLDALERTVVRGLESTESGLHALSADLLTVSTAITTGPPWPKVPLPAAAVAPADLPSAEPGPMPTAAGEHESRSRAARRRTRHLLIVDAPPAAPPGTTATSATVLPFRRS